MPYVAESLIVLQHDKLVALIYPDFDDAFAHGLQQTDIVKVMEANRIELNQQLPNYSQISKVKSTSKNLKRLRRNQSNALCIRKRKDNISFEQDKLHLNIQQESKTVNRPKALSTVFSF